jgi:general secretion pathway protein H
VSEGNPHRRFRIAQLVHPRSPRGLTLIELTVAIAIAGALFAALILGLGALTGTRARKALGELGGAARSLYDTAALTGHTCRLALLLPKDDAAEFSYRAECASGAVASALDRDQELRDVTKTAADAEKRGGRRTSPTSGSRSGSGYGSGSSSGSSLLDVLDAEKERVEKATSFSAFTSPEIQPRKMSGVRVSVWTSHQRAKVDSGPAYLYFFPQGYTERAQVTVRQGPNVWTLVVAPLTGKTSIVAGEMEIPKS